jgi:hypothetical protein
MADEITTSTVNEFVAAEIVSDDIIEAAYSAAIMPALVKVSSITGENTLTVNMSKMPELAADDLTEGTDAANTAFSPSEVPVTAREVGIMLTVGDVAASTGVANLADYSGELGKAVAKKIDEDLLAEAADFSNSVGTTEVDMTEQDFLDAIYVLENGNAQGPFVAVLHPIQVADLRKALSSSTGAIWGGPSVPSGDLGAFASLYGIDVFKSTNCASVDTNANRQGVMMPMGQSSGLAYVSKEGVNTEFQRDASLRATEIVTTVVYGDECVNPAANGGVAIITDHE